MTNITLRRWTPCLNKDGDAEMIEDPRGAFVLLSEVGAAEPPAPHFEKSVKCRCGRGYKISSEGEVVLRAVECVCGVTLTAPW